MLRTTETEPAIRVVNEQSEPPEFGRAAEMPAVEQPAEDTVCRSTGERASPGGQTCLRLYLCEIGKVKLLTPTEEIELAARINKGDKQAREQMIKSNLRLVVKIARDYEGLGVPLL